jgi:hypothetical protein
VRLKPQAHRSIPVVQHGGSGRVVLAHANRILFGSAKRCALNLQLTALFQSSNTVVQAVWHDQLPISAAYGRAPGFWQASFWRRIALHQAVFEC